MSGFDMKCGNEFCMYFDIGELRKVSSEHEAEVYVGDIEWTVGYNANYSPAEPDVGIMGTQIEIDINWAESETGVILTGTAFYELYPGNLDEELREYLPEPDEPPPRRRGRYLGRGRHRDYDD